ncbi:MAG TPA: outer membrane beta-barrel protein, partial [Saprospiraceae bacterium]|nr:outer membrane beta-barrel protein [Saprospiraceae bacterium]
LTAQKLPVVLTIEEARYQPVIGATVKIFPENDSTQVQRGATDTLGQVRVLLEEGRLYRLIVSALGFQPLEKGLRPNSSKSTFAFTLQPETNALGAVTVTARKPLLRQEEDKTIVDPEPIAATSTSAFEIVEKTPGLFVDQDGNIYLNSSTPATVYINGREQRMSAADIANILKNLPPGSIERLEILRTPSAKYDASGSGGVVNVVLKKGVKIGRTGSVNAGFNQGTFGNQYGGISLNDSNGGRSSSVQLSASRRDGFERISTTRLLSGGSQLKQDAYTHQPSAGAFGNYSLGYEPAQDWELLFDGRASYNVNRPESTNESTVRQRNGGLVESDNLNTLRNVGRNLFLNQGGRLKRTLDTLGSECTTDVAYNFTHYEGTQDFDISFLEPFSAFAVGGDGNIGTERHFFTAQTDLRLKWPGKLSLEAGLKTAFQHFRSSTDYFATVNGQRKRDPFRTNAYRYSDGVHAAYLQGSKTFSAYILKLGLRAEITNMAGRQTLPADTSYLIRRTDLFPYLYFSRRIVDIAGYELRGFLIYRRSINRPNYEVLNPFPRFVDQYLYETGNAGLRPEFTQNIEFNISAGDYPIFAVGRNYVTDLFTRVIYQDADLPEVAYRTYDNLGENRETYFRLTGAMPPGGKYFFVLGTQYNLNEYDGLYEGAPLRFRRGSWNFFTYHQLRL